MSSLHQKEIPGRLPARQVEKIRQELDVALERVIQRAVFMPDIEVKAFQEEFAQFIGAEYGVGVASGGSGVTLALLALGIKPGDEVISVPNVDLSASAPISHSGARIVWTDIDPHTHNLDPNQLEEKITPRTKAIVVVHMYGNPVDMEAVLEISHRQNVPVVEDASLAHGAVYKGKKVGTFGQMGCFSCNPNKILGALGAAGIVVTNDEALAEKLQVISNYGFEPSCREAMKKGVPGARFRYQLEGYNSSLDELQAAVLRVKLRHLPEWIARRRENASIYYRLLAELSPEYLSLPQDTPASEPVYRVFVIRSHRRDELQLYLAQKGISTGLPYVPPAHLHSIYGHFGYGLGSFPKTEQAAEELLALPTIPELTTQEVMAIAEAVTDFFKRDTLSGKRYYT